MADISVILPCYNVEKEIDRCLQSIINQTIGADKLEIICVDDCSTDNTYGKLLKWEKEYPDSIIVIKCSENGRQGRARNIGLEYATAELIGFIDSDDWIERDYFETLYNTAVKGKYDVVACDYDRDFSKELSYFKNETGKYVNNKVYIVENDEQRREFIINPPLKYNAWSKLIKKSFIIDNDLFFPENITYEDACWGSLVHLYVNKSCFVGKKLYHYYVNDESTVLKKDSYHHLDCITTQNIAWGEYEKRGFLDKYRNELQIEHIYSGYLAGIKMAVLKFEEPNYNIYLLLRSVMSSRIADYEKNPYIQNGILSEYHMLILKTIKNELSREAFSQMATYIKKIGI